MLAHCLGSATGTCPPPEMRCSLQQASHSPWVVLQWTGRPVRHIRLPPAHRLTAVLCVKVIRGNSNRYACWLMLSSYTRGISTPSSTTCSGSCDIVHSIGGLVNNDVDALSHLHKSSIGKELLRGCFYVALHQAALVGVVADELPCAVQYVCNVHSSSPTPATSSLCVSSASISAREYVTNALRMRHTLLLVRSGRTTATTKWQPACAMSHSMASSDSIRLVQSLVHHRHLSSSSKLYSGASSAKVTS